MIFCALKKGGLQFFQQSFRGSHNLSCHNLVYTEVGLKIPVTKSDR